jgi:hypothetical protein
VVPQLGQKLAQLDILAEHWVQDTILDLPQATKSIISLYTRLAIAAFNVDRRDIRHIVYNYLIVRLDCI